MSYDKIIQDTVLCAIASNEQIEDVILMQSSNQQICMSLLWSFAVRNRVETIVWHELSKLEMEWDNFNRKECHETRQNEITSRVAQIDIIARLLDEHYIKSVILENAAIARLNSFCLGCFKFGDLDFLVTHNDLNKIKTILEKSGYKFLSDRNGRIEFEITDNDGVKTEIYFQDTLVARKLISGWREPAADVLIERAINFDTSCTKRLNNEDFLFQLIIHSASHSYIRAPGVLLHLDVHRFLKVEEVDWDVFLSLVHNNEVKNVAYWSLWLPKKLFGSKVPDRVLLTLMPPVWKRIIIERWINKVGLFNPHEKKFGKVGYIVFNYLLYDSIWSFIKGLLPSSRRLKEHYKFESNLLLPVYYVRRIANLLFKRVM